VQARGKKESMIKNYFKIAFRNLWKHKAFSLINILGLTVGLTAGFLIFLYVSFELSYDNFHSKADRTYRVVADIKTPTEVLHAHGPSWAVPHHIKLEFPEVEQSVRVAGDDNLLIRRGDVKYMETNVMWADSGFFKIFDFKLIKGDPVKALTEPFSIVFTESAAKKYFGKEDPIGQSVLITGEGRPAKVTGIMKDIPENSQIKGDMVLSMSTITREWNKDLDNQFGNYGAQAFLLLKPGTDPKAFEKKLPGFLERRNGKKMKESQMFATLFLEPLRDVYLYTTRSGSSTGNINNVYIFSIVAIFILAIACINFVNLTTARSTERAREVGIRKVVGALRAQLTGQFIGESIMLCVIAFLLSIGLISLLIPSFNTVAGKTVSEGLFSIPSYVLILFGAALGIGLLAGFYPALVLSSFKPVTVLKGRFSTGRRGIFLRKGLVVAQFTISIALIIGTIVVYNQMSYMRNRELGFSKDQMVVIDTNGDPNKDAFKQSLTGLPMVKSVSISGSVPGSGNPGAYSQIENTKGEFQIANLDLYFVDFDYINHYKMKVLAGRGFSRDFMTDTTQAMVMNEAAIKMFGYSKPEQAIGKKFKQWGREGKIIGVIKDFHFRGLQTPIKPLSMRIEPGGSNLVSVNVSGNDIKGTLKVIEDKWKTALPNKPFNYYFLDEHFDRQYRAEERFGKLFFNFSVLAIFISCLGLLGLASYSTMQRTKEIGIRKVMGASVSNILNLLSRDFLTLVIISFFVAAPVAWYFMHEWLKDFAYRTEIAWWVFAISGILAVVIAVGTISFMAIKAAVANPVKSLRTE
jgi:putative ABC transport system permease protein